MFKLTLCDPMILLIIFNVFNYYKMYILKTETGGLKVTFKFLERLIKLQFLLHE